MKKISQNVINKLIQRALNQCLMRGSVELKIIKDRVVVNFYYKLYLRKYIIKGDSWKLKVFKEKGYLGNLFKTDIVYFFKCPISIAITFDLADIHTIETIKNAVRYNLEISLRKFFDYLNETR